MKHNQQKIRAVMITSLFLIFTPNAALSQKYCESLRVNEIKKMQGAEGYSGGISGYTPVSELIVQMNIADREASIRLYSSLETGFSGGISGYVPVMELIAQINFARYCPKLGLLQKP